MGNSLHVHTSGELGVLSAANRLGAATVLLRPVVMVRLLCRAAVLVIRMLLCMVCVA